MNYLNVLPFRGETQFASSYHEIGKFKNLRLLIEKAAGKVGSEYGILLYKAKAVKVGLTLTKSCSRSFYRKRYLCSV